MIKNGIPTCWLLRKVVEEETTYAKTVQRLKATKIAGPVYFAISGIQGNEGIIIERDSDNIHAAYELSDSTWFLVQTNYDRDQPDPKDDQRRISAENRLIKIGNSNFNEQTLFDVVMSQYPTLNVETIYTVVMMSSTGYHNTTAWYGQNSNPDHLASE